MKIPHNPKQYEGRWAVTLSHRIFKIEEAGLSPATGMAFYHGRSLQGRPVSTHIATVLCQEDCQDLDERGEA